MPGGADLSIGAVAEATGVAVSALRYYDELGLIVPVDRVAGQRRFSPDVCGTVNFIRRAQRFGFSLEEVGVLLDDTERDWVGLVAAKLNDLRQQRVELDSMIHLLAEVQTCGCEVVASCPRIETDLAEHPETAC